jgi:hypothetical protein
VGLSQGLVSRAFAVDTAKAPMGITLVGGIAQAGDVIEFRDYARDGGERCTYHIFECRFQSHESCSDFRTRSEASTRWFRATSFRHIITVSYSTKGVSPVKKVLLFLAGALMLIGTLSTPTLSVADGGPMSGNCPPTMQCKP